jgi:hypothetical protein
LKPLSNAERTAEQAKPTANEKPELRIDLGIKNCQKYDTMRRLWTGTGSMVHIVPTINIASPANKSLFPWAWAGEGLFLQIEQQQAYLREASQGWSDGRLCDKETGGYDYSNLCTRYILHQKARLRRNMMTFQVEIVENGSRNVAIRVNRLQVHYANLVLDNWLKRRDWLHWRGKLRELLESKFCRERMITTARNSRYFLLPSWQRQRQGEQTFHPTSNK